jgi:hypothetical protein
MPRKVFTAGEVLAAADVNEFLQDQAVMTFAGTAARGSAIGTATEGMFTYLEDTDTYESYNGTDWVSALPMGAWTAFTPTWTGLTVGNGVYNQSHYSLIGKTASFSIDFSFGSTSAITGSVTLTLPVILTRKSNFSTNVLYSYFEDSGTGDRLGFPIPNTSDSTKYLVGWANQGVNVITRASLSSTSPFTWATGDRIVITGTIEVA